MTRNVAEGERVSDRLAGETIKPDESQQGYPEEQPEGTDPSGGDPPSEETPQRQGGRTGHARDDDDGKATGNPRSAG